MPSINRYMPVHGGRRIRTNTCEGSVSIADEAMREDAHGGGKWTQRATINLTREQAQKLIEQLTDQMAKNF